MPHRLVVLWVTESPSSANCPEKEKSGWKTSDYIKVRAVALETLRDDGRLHYAEWADRVAAGVSWIKMPCQ